MASFDLNFPLSVQNALASQVINTDTTTTGVIIDLNDGTNDFEGALFVLKTGTHTAGDFSLLLEESDNGVDFTACAADDVLGDNTPIAASNTTLQLSYVGKKQYVRPSVVSANSANSEVTGVVVLGHARSLPVA
jgi:hypothetical protein